MQERGSAIREVRQIRAAPPRRHPVRGYLSIAAAAFCWGGAASLGRAVFTGRMFAHLPPLGPVIITQTRISFSLLILTPVVLWLGGRSALVLSKKEVVRCFVLGVFGMSMANFLYYLAIAKTTVATAIILFYTAPVWVLLYLLARGKQQATVRRISAVTAAVVGCGLAIGIGGPAHLRLNGLGVAAGLLGAVAFAFYNVYGHGVLAQNERWRVLVYAFFGATMFWMMVNPPWAIAAAHYSARQWGFMVMFSVISILLPFSFYFVGLQYLDATRAVVTSCLQPVFAILFAVAFIAESLHWLQAVGIVIVLAASIAIQIPEKRGETATDVRLTLAE
ncbi:MAG TPA: DMT family transporter [Terriglobales bacterium]|nr:DMT family transporter [Terriglobales bacterium]